MMHFAWIVMHTLLLEGELHVDLYLDSSETKGQ